MAPTPFNNQRRNQQSAHADNADALPFWRRRIVVLGVSVAAAVFACAAVLLGWQYLNAPQAANGSTTAGAPLLNTIRNITYKGEFNYLRPQDLQLFSNSIRGNIWSVDLNEVRAAAQAYPWVRVAEVRRSFPDGLTIRLEEHLPFAHWGEGEYSFVNSFGEVFEILPSSRKPITVANSVAPNSSANALKMPVLRGSSGTVTELVKHYQWLQKSFAPLDRRVAEVQLTGRGALRVRDNRGTVIELGRFQTEERLQRVLSAWPHVAAMQQPNMHIDARYPSGLALSVNVVVQSAATAATGEGDADGNNLPPPEEVIANNAALKNVLAHGHEAASLNTHYKFAPPIKATGNI